MEHHTIKIKLDPDGNISYTNLDSGGNTTSSGSRLIAKAEDKIDWVCEGGRAFAVHFMNSTPFGKVRHRCGGEKKISREFHNPVPTGVYKYFVAVVAENDKIWTDDPEIIVDE
jgi:hypothetical protein